MHRIIINKKQVHLPIDMMTCHVTQAQFRLMFRRSVEFLGECFEDEAFGVRDMIGHPIVEKVEFILALFMKYTVNIESMK